MEEFPCFFSQLVAKSASGDDSHAAVTLIKAELYQWKASILASVFMRMLQNQAVALSKSQRFLRQCFANTSRWRGKITTGTYFSPFLTFIVGLLLLLVVAVAVVAAKA